MDASIHPDITKSGAARDPFDLEIADLNSVPHENDLVDIKSAVLAKLTLACGKDVESATDRDWFVATALACAGVALLALSGGGSEVSGAGVLLAVGAGASYAVFTLASKRLLDQGHGVESVMAALFTGGAVLLSPVLLFGDVGWLSTAGGFAMALWLGAVPTAIAYILFASGLRHLPANEVATLTLAEPVTAAILGAVVLGERPGPAAIAGVVVVLSGLAVLAVATTPTTAQECPA